MEPPTLIIGSFGIIIKSDDQEIDLNKFTKSFNLDVSLNPNKTFLQQEQNGIIRAVSKSYIKMCRINKNINVVRPEGFVKIQYSKKTGKQKVQALADTFGRQTISRPPIGPIPQGAWCSVCGNVGPYFHKENCSNPVEDVLKVTLFGFISCVIEKDSIIEEDEDGDIIILKNLFLSKMADRTTIAKSEYLELFNSFELDGIDSNKEPVDDWPLLNIFYKKVVSYKNKKDKSFFSNCSIVSYNFPESGSTSIRVYKSGLIHLVSCPWEYKTFYTKFVKELNNSEGIISKTSGTPDTFIINTNESLVTTVFSSYNLLPDNLELNLQALYNYFWPQDDSGIPILNNISPKRVFTKVYTQSKNEVDHNYLINPFSESIPFYRYEIEYRNDLSTQKIIMKLIPCLGNKDTNIPKFCKPYKLTLMIFKSGKVQSIFSYCKEEDIGLTEDKLCDENPYVLPDNILDQYKDIQKELEHSMEFIYQSIERVINTVTFEIDSKVLDKKNINTVQGIFPYKKKESIKIGDIIEIFNSELMDWGSKGEVTNSKDGLFEIEIIEYNDHNEIEKSGEVIENLSLRDIRPMKQSSMQISRSKIPGSDIENKPVPYGFKGKCSGGNKYYIPMEGKQARDNLYYPYCSVKKKDKYNIHIDRILNGFPNTEEEETDFNIQKDAQFDLYSGMIKQDVLEIGKSVKFLNNGDEYEGIIVDKYNTNDRGLDNVVLYKIETDDSTFEIQGSDLLPEYREDRRWEGLGNPALQRIKLMECAKKLGLAQSPYTTDNQNIKLQSKVLQHLKTVTGLDSQFVKNTSVLTPSSFTKFEDRSYMAVAFPSGSQRVLLLSYKGKHYFIDESMLIMKLDFDFDSNFTVLLDGYIKKTDVITYYPIDCLHFGINNSNKLNMSYFSEEGNELNSEDEIFEFIESLDIDTQKYTNIVESLKYGRIFYTIMMNKLYSEKNTKNSVKFAKPEQYIVPFVGKPNILNKISINPNDVRSRSIIEDVNTLFKRTDTQLDLTFIPQKGSGNFLRWKRQLKTQVVLELIKKNKNGYTVGIGEQTINPIKETVINIPAPIIEKIKNKKRKFIRFDLNFMNNGKLNPEDPITLDVIEPVVTHDDAMSHKRTQLIVDAMISPIPERIFLSRIEWKLVIPKYLILVTNETNPGISPLISDQ